MMKHHQKIRIRTDNTNIDVKNCSENTEMAQSIVESDVGEKQLGQGDLHKCDVQESVWHLNVKDIKSFGQRGACPKQ